MPHIILPLDVHNGSIRYYANSRKGAERVAKMFVPVCTLARFCSGCACSIFARLDFDVRIVFACLWRRKEKSFAGYAVGCFFRIGWMKMKDAKYIQSKVSFDGISFHKRNFFLYI